MAKRISFETVREIGRRLPGVEEGTAYGSPALKIGGRMFACLAIHRSAEPDSLVLQLPFEQRDELIAAEPAIYYLTDHYVEHPTVLVRLSRIDRDALTDLLRTARDFVARPKPRRPRSTTAG